MRILWLALVATTALAQDVKHGELVFAAHCAGCHGANGAGGELGPNITDGVDDTLFTQPLPTFIRQGVPEAGMPSFATLPASDLAAVVSYITMLRAPASAKPPAGSVAAGQAYYFGAGACATCHMIRGQGGVLGPDLTGIGDHRRISRLEQALLHPGSPPREGYRVVSVTRRDGGSLRGLARNESNYDLQLEDLNGQLHYFSRDEIAAVSAESTSLMPPVTAGRDTVRDLLAFLSRLTTTGGPEPITSADESALTPDTATADWPTYNGHMSGNRYSALHEIDTTTVHRLAPAWLFPIPNARHLEGTPVVVDGTMFVTTANEAYALDARTGRPVWHYARALTSGVIGDAAGAINRGVAVLGDRVFMVTDHAHLIALARANGALLWDVEMADYHKHYGATSAPLVVNDLVLSGTSGGDEGDRGFIAAYDARTGRQVWRFSTVPSPGEPAAATWRGRALGHACAAAWLTGTYDAATGIVYWPTGNPCPDYNGDERQGDNLYSSSVLALEAKTGRLVWYYQYTPHNLHDWDAAQTPMLVDDGPRKLLLQANRNGFFYVLDRVTGHLVLSRPFVHKLTWASSIGSDGRPVLIPGSDPSPLGTKACPSLEGATNWMSTSFNPSTHLYYVMALEACSIFSKSSAWWTPGQSFYGGGANRVPGEHRQKVLRAIDPETGETAWEVPQIGTGDSWGGVLSTAGGVVFYGDDAGALAAVSASTGAPLWHFHTNAVWHASPMTYAVNGHQYIAAAAGGTIIAFALPQ
ncbi:MAG TPA: PQQ-binding-like beta-propeller repeat protein [Gemmatimonadaceae bacterium]|nr:PQQ-binding-like beta-propeller repeat protein [Gemmatimonadaceae bacterium]